MAYSTQRVTPTETIDQLLLSIDYLDRKDITVFFDGIADAGRWSWIGDTDSIAFDPAVEAGTEILVARTTALDKMLNIFGGGAGFNNATMDENFTQLLMLTQEAVEGSGLTDVFNDVDYHGFRMKNVVAVEPTDAVSLGQATAATSGFATAAANSATLAQAWATQLVTPVGGGLYSARYYAQAASDSASEAAGYAALLPNATGQANKMPRVNAAGDGWVYVTFTDIATELGLGSAAYGNIGTTVQPYDAATAKTNVSQVFYAPQKSDLPTAHTGTVNLSSGAADVVITPTGPITLSFTNIASNAGKRGFIVFTNSSNYVITKGSNIKAPATLFSTLSATGDYLLAYHCDGTNVRLTGSGALT